MPESIREYTFLDGLAVGELIGRLKHQEPAELKLWAALEQLQDFKAVLRKYNYSISGVTSHPSQPNQVLLSAEKIAAGTDPELMLAFARSEEFMNGCEVGCLVGQVRYTQPDQVDEWVRVNNIDAIRDIINDLGYVITTLQLHPQYNKWMQLVAQRQLCA
jgi:hypothetical protein